MYRLTSTGKPAIPADLKYSNRIQVINAFLKTGTSSATEIAAQIGLSRQTVMKSIQFFLNTGLLVSAGKGDSTSIGGKRPECYALSQRKFFLCITLWPQELRLHLYTIGHEQVDSINLYSPLPEDARAAIDNVGHLSATLLAKNHVAPEDLCAVSLSTAGIVDRKTGHLKYSSQSPTWGAEVPLQDYLRDYFSPNTLIFLENAGKMTARPFLLEPSLYSKRVLVIFACWGLSSCLIEKNHILTGKNSLIGEIGHMVIDPNDTELCGCGSKGCLERLVSIGRLRQLLQQQADAYPGSRLLAIPPQELTLPDVFAASAAGDALAQWASAYLAHTFAYALRNISLVFDPDLVVFQGDYAYADPLFDRCLREELSAFHYFPKDMPFDLRYDRRSLVEMDAYGSYVALVNEYFSSPELYREQVPEA